MVAEGTAFHSGAFHSLALFRVDRHCGQHKHLGSFSGCVSEVGPREIRRKWVHLHSVLQVPASLACCHLPFAYTDHMALDMLPSVLNSVFPVVGGKFWQKLEEDESVQKVLPESLLQFTHTCTSTGSWQPVYFVSISYLETLALIFKIKI